MPKKPSKASLFIELAQPDKDGFADKVSIEKFTGRYAGLVFGNGGSWCRDDGGLATLYNIRRHKTKGRITGVSLHGYKKHIIRKEISPAIRRELSDKCCVVLGTSNVEIDHKDGRRDDTKPKSEQQTSDFQPLSKAANDAKRNHCKQCRETDKRFDATTLGYAKSQVKGNGTYRGSCVGCFWFDPKAFRSEL